MKAKFLLPVLTFSVFSFSVYSQTGPAINSIKSSFDTLRNRLPIEKAYLQLDKPYYTTGDTLWFKAYLIGAAYLNASVESGLLYLELANDTGKVLQRNMVVMNYGLGRGNIFLNKENIPEGSYTVRAYTNLMRNFSEDYVFKKNFYIGGSADQSWLIKSDTRLIHAAGKDSVRLALQLSKLTKETISLRELQIRVMDGKRVLARDKVQTDVDGELDISFTLPEKADGKNISIIAEDPNNSGTRIIVPVQVNRPENIDLQFMPEGGNLVAGMRTKVGFKAIGEDGKGTDVKGKVVSSSQSPVGSSSSEVAAFSSVYKGMASFEFIPQAGESYTAQITLPDGSIKNFPLPQIKASGTALRISNPAESDSLEINVSMTAPAPATLSPATYYLIAQSRGIICYGAMIRFTGTVNTRKIAKSLFPTGVARFTLLSADRQPLNERIVFIDHQDNLNISINTNKENYHTRDSIALEIRVTDRDNNPVPGSFSIAVTDDTQVKTDSLGSTILTNLLLTSDLKGTVEEPGYYFQEGDTQRWEALDNLLLTQGWVGYNWNDVFSPPLKLEYQAEPEFMVKGRVSNILNKDVEGSKITLRSLKPLIFTDALTDKEGLFSFRGFPQLDTVSFMLQAVNRRGQSFNVGIEAEEFKPPVFRIDNRSSLPWYMNTDTTLLKFLNSTITQKKEENKLTGKNILEEVTITAKKIIKGSHNLNGPGVADIILDEKDMAKAQKQTLYELLSKKFPGFYRRLLPPAPPGSGSGSLISLEYRFDVRIVNLVIDGVFIKDLGLPVDDYMNFLTAEDIRGIEIMSSVSNKIFYDPPKWRQSNGAIQNEFGRNPPVFFEITTWSGNGAFLHKIPGMYLYKPMPFAGSKTFYSPKYTLKNTGVPISDFRSTIHWAPDVITDAEGKATVSFYSSDRAGTYTVIAEGSDMNGNIGSKRSSIKIEK